MNGYRITIAPDEGSGATAILHVDVTSEAPRLTKVILLAAEGQHVSTAALSGLDAERLVAALMPATSGARKAEATPPASPWTSAMSSREAEDATGDAEDAPVTTVQRPASRPVGVRTTTRSRASTPKAGTTAKKSSSAAAPQPARLAGRTRKTVVADSRAGASGRVYRTMPDDFLTSFGQSTMADLAQRFRVPLYTVQSWVNTARKQGKLPSARKRKMRAT